jgi:hypothetical protein
MRIPCFSDNSKSLDLTFRAESIMQIVKPPHYLRQLRGHSVCELKECLCSVDEIRTMEGPILQERNHGDRERPIVQRLLHGKKLVIG